MTRWYLIIRQFADAGPRPGKKKELPQLGCIQSRFDGWAAWGFSVTQRLAMSYTSTTKQHHQTTLAKGDERARALGHTGLWQNSVLSMAGSLELKT